MSKDRLDNLIKNQEKKSGSKRDVESRGSKRDSRGRDPRGRDPRERDATRRGDVSEGGKRPPVKKKAEGEARERATKRAGGRPRGDSGGVKLSNNAKMGLMVLGIIVFIVVLFKFIKFAWDNPIDLDGGKIVKTDDDGNPVNDSVDDGLTDEERLEALREDSTFVQFGDPDLEEAVADALGTFAPISKEDMLELEEFEYWGTDLEDLTGLEYARNLKRLDLYNNDIKDIRQVANLTKLEYLNLSHNQIENIAAISKLVELEEVNIASNRITSAGALGALPKLKIADASDNRLVSCSTLSMMPAVEVLKINSNGIRDLHMLKDIRPEIKTLWIFENDTEGLAGHIKDFPEIPEFVWK